MKLYIAGRSGYVPKLFSNPETRPPYNMGSFWYLGGNHTETEKRGKMDQAKLDYVRSDACESFMLDSGAFTLLTNTDERARKISLIEEYTEDYIDFVNEHDRHIDHYFEVDVDPLIGTEKTRQIRRKIERETGRPSIPVWHPCRGKDAFLDLAEEYDYIALGGIYDEISPKWFKHFPWFIKQAHERDAKIHGLGFTPTKNMERFPFDSVDSTGVWSGRFGSVYRFDPIEGKLRTEDREGTSRVDDPYQLDKHNMKQWLRWVRYLENRGGDT